MAGYTHKVYINKKKKENVCFFNLLCDFMSVETLPAKQAPSCDREQMGGPYSLISIFGLFNVLWIKMLIKILRDEIYFGGTADVNYEKGGIKLSLCLH